MTHVVKLSSVNKIYQSEDLKFQALKNINLNIAKGEFIAVVGPSGSGKSTLMHILGLLDKPTSGIYELDGRNASKLSENHLAQIRNEKIGFVFQSFNLLSRTSALDNAALPLIYSGVSRPERLKRAKKALEDVGLGDKLSSRPNQLSGGQQQRVAVARAIVAEPVLVLADEPTANLDSVTGAALMDLMRRLNETRGITFVFSTHDPMVMQRARRLVHLKDGRVVG